MLHMEWHSIDDGHYQLLYDRNWGSLTGHAIYADMYQISNMHSTVLIDDRYFTFQPPNYKLSMKASQKEGHRPQTVKSSAQVTGAHRHFAFMCLQLQITCLWNIYAHEHHVLPMESLEAGGILAMPRSPR